jgi:predicted ATPase
MKNKKATNSYHFRNFSVSGWMSYKNPLAFIFKDINFIIGPNNSGKSNLLKLIVFARKLLEAIALYKRSVIHEDDLDINMEDIFNKYSRNKTIIISLETSIAGISGELSVELHISRSKEKKTVHISKLLLRHNNNILYEIVNHSHLRINYHLIKEIIDKSFKLQKRAKEYRILSKEYNEKKDDIMVNNETFDKIIYLGIEAYNEKYNENITIDDLDNCSDYFVELILDSVQTYSTNKRIGFLSIHFDATKYIQSEEELSNFLDTSLSKFEYLYFNIDLIYLLLNGGNVIGYSLKPNKAINIIFESLSSDKTKYIKPKIPIEVINIIRDQIISATYIPIDCVSNFTYIGFQQDGYTIPNDMLGQLKSLLINSKSAEISILLNKYLPNMGIGDKIRIVRIDQVNEIQVFRSGSWVPDRLLGSGARKMLHLILDIVYNGIIRLNHEFLKSLKDKGMNIDTRSSHKILLEEPEANLHPGLQSKLAELIVEASRDFLIQFIVETHSEYLIRKLQYLVANGECESNAIQIFYLNFDHLEKTTIKRDISITNRGTLTHPFGPGFFDEADKLTLDLFLLSGGADN